MVFLYIPFLFSWPSHFFTWQINERSVGKTSRDSYEENYILDPPFSPSCISHHVTGFCKSTQLRTFEQETSHLDPFVMSILYIIVYRLEVYFINVYVCVSLTVKYDYPKSQDE